MRPEVEAQLLLHITAKDWVKKVHWLVVQAYTGCLQSTSNILFSFIFTTKLKFHSIKDTLTKFWFHALHMGLSRRKCPVFQKTKLRIVIIIWIIIEIWTLNFMFLTRKLAGNVKYIYLVRFFITVREKKCS